MRRRLCGRLPGRTGSHLIDVLSDAEEILGELGVHFEANASEAAAAAMLAASVNYPIRGAVTFKGPVGANVAADALANLSSGGVTGGALVILGEDYGEGSSIMQERTHAFATKSQLWLLDPRPNLPSMVKAVRDGFELSEASNTPVILEVRIRACHVYGAFEAEDNRRPPLTVREALENPQRRTDRIALPPNTYRHEMEKVTERMPAALDFIQKRGLNERFGGDGEIGIILQGGMYNGVVRALQRLGLADAYGESEVPLYVLNVTYPLVDAEVIAFYEGKKAVLVVEEGQPAYIEDAIAAILYRAGATCRLAGKGALPMAGEYTGAVLMEGVTQFLANTGGAPARRRPRTERRSGRGGNSGPLQRRPDPPAGLLHRLPGAADLRRNEAGGGGAGRAPHRERHWLSPLLDPAALRDRLDHHGLWARACVRRRVERRGGPAFDQLHRRRRLLAQRPHLVRRERGLQRERRRDRGGGQLLRRRHRGQDVPSSRAKSTTKSTQHPIADAVKGLGVKWVKQIDHTYDVGHLKETLTEALTTPETGPKVIIASSECMLNKQRRERPARQAAIKGGERVVVPRFGVDEDVCTGDHACMRLSGCPSLLVKSLDDPLHDDPVAAIDESCVGCGNCGEVAEAAVLCPSFHRVDIVRNPGVGERIAARLSGAAIGWLQARRDRRRLVFGEGA